MAWQLPIPCNFTETKDSESFRTVPMGWTEIPLPPHPGCYGAIRRFDVHGGLDFYCPEGTPVRAVEKGEVVAILPFTGEIIGMPWWKNTYVAMIEGKSGVVFYGEIAPLTSLSVGTKLEAGQQIGNVLEVLMKDKGRPRAMLHLELHKHGTRSDPYWRVIDGVPVAEEKPESMLDPTPFILEAARTPVIKSLHAVMQEITEKALRFSPNRQNDCNQSLSAVYHHNKACSHG